MRLSLQLFITLYICLSICACKKGGDDNGGGGTPGVKDITVMLNTQEQAIEHYESSWIQYHDTLRAAFDMGQWLLTQEAVKNVYLVDDEHVSIRYKSGLWSNINLHRKAASGRFITRDGGGGYAPGGIQTYVLGGHGKTPQPLTKNIGNKKVMIFLTAEDEFYPGGYPFLPLFDKASEKLEVTLVRKSAATFSVFKTFKDYGFIIIDSHGEFDGGILVYSGVEAFDLPSPAKLTTWKEEDVANYIAQSGNELLGLLQNGKIHISMDATIPEQLAKIGSVETSIGLYVSDEYIQDMPDKLKDAVVLGNFCYSGGTNPVRYEGDDNTNRANMPAAWQAAGAAAYYGYAFKDGMTAKVSNDFCVRMEDSMINRLVLNGDSTGTAHLAGGTTEQSYEAERFNRQVAVPALTKEAWTDYIKTVQYSFTDKLYLNQHHSPEYAYGCGTFTDPRDTQTYKLTCIGNQKWFAENLRYNAPGSLYPNNDPSKVKEMGRLYNYAAASAGQGSTKGSSTIRGVCPQGWHIPTLAEWQGLETALKPTDNAELAVMLQSASTSWTGDPELGNPKRNSSGFSAMPAGIAFRSPGSSGPTYNYTNATFVLSTHDDGYVSPEAVHSGRIEQATSSKSAKVSTTSQWVNAAATPALADSYYSCRCVQD